MEEEVWSAEPDIERIIHTYGDMLFRICLVILRNESDAEDVLQDTLITYITKAPTFHDLEHEKAWLITVATNRCKNIYRFNFIRRHINVDDLQLYRTDQQHHDLLEQLMRLSPKYKTVLLLHYVEGYKVNEIATMLGITSAAVKKRLQRGRENIRKNYQKEEDSYEF